MGHRERVIICVPIAYHTSCLPNCYNTSLYQLFGTIFGIFGRRCYRADFLDVTSLWYKQMTLSTSTTSMNCSIDNNRSPHDFSSTFPSCFIGNSRLIAGNTENLSSTLKNVSVEPSTSCWHELLPNSIDDALIYLQQPGQNKAMVITDRHCVITHVNNAWSILCEYESDEVIGRTFRFMQGAATDMRCLDNLNNHISLGLPFDAVLNNYTKSGRMFRNYLQVKALRTYAHSGKEEITHFLGILTDLDSKRRLCL